MKVLILAGGLGTRLGEETSLKPKPMVEIGGKPMIWHIMKIYSSYGFNEFVVLTGYMGYQFKEYFTNYFLHSSDITIDLSTNEMQIHRNTSDPWRVTVIDTGLESMTGSRVKRAKEHVDNQTFMLTYGDGVSDVDIAELVAFHKAHGKAITMTAVQPEGRFGTVRISDSNRVSSFKEKPQNDKSWINGGFFVCEPRVLDYIGPGKGVVFEQEPLEGLANDGELFAYQHKGFWMCMDTLRDKIRISELWDAGSAPWNTWSS